MIRLVFPPPWDTFTAYASIPVLLTDLNSRGIEAEGLDLNLKLINTLLTPQNLLNASSRLSEINLDSLPESAKSIFRYLKDRSEFAVNNIEESLNRLRAKEYELSNTPRIDWEIISLSTQLLSFPFFPCIWHRNSYWIYKFPKKRPQTLKDVFEHLESPQQDFFYWAFQRDEIISEVLKGDIKMLGISICTLSQLIPAFALCKVVKNLNKGIHIVIGGPFLRYIKEPIMKNAEVFSYIDLIVFGRGEGTLADLYHAFVSGLNWRTVPGVTYLGSKGTVVCNEKTEILKYNVFSPPDYEKMNIKSYLCDEFELSYISSSGCYWGKCAFCSETGASGDYRYMVKSSDIVVKEMHQIYLKTGIKVFEMSDNAIPVNKAMKIAEYIIKNNLPITWTMLARAEKGFGPDELAYLKKGGLRFVSWGIETFNGRYQQYINKGIDLDIALKILENSHNVGIWNHLFLIIGFPGETNGEMLQMLDLLECYSEYIDSISLSNFHLHRNSYMYNEPEKYGIRIRGNADDIIDTSYWFDHDEESTDISRDGFYGLFEMYLSNFHFHTSNFKGFSTAKLVTLSDQYGKSTLREYFKKESLNKTLELAGVL